MKHFSPKQLHEFLCQPDHDALLLDVREPWEFEYCNISGSVLIPMGELASDLQSGEVELDPQRITIMICHHGIRSRQMGYYMEQAGFKNIINLDGGVEQWAQDIDSSMKRY